MRALPILIGFAAVMTGCGAGEQKQVRATIAADARAYEGHDWNAVCSLRTGAGRREFLRASLRPTAPTCAEAWTPAPGGNEPILSFEFKRPEHRPAEIDGDDDVAHVRYDDGAVEALRKVNGRWL